MKTFISQSQGVHGQMPLKYGSATVVQPSLNISTLTICGGIDCCLHIVIALITACIEADSTIDLLQVSISWHGHFINELQHSRKFLNGIAPSYPPLNTNYDETTGQPPDTVSMEVRYT